MTSFKSYKEIVDFISDAEASYDLRLLVPTNLSDQKQKFFSSRINPSFIYPALDTNIDLDITNYNFEFDGSHHVLYQDRLEFCLNLVELYTSRGNDLVFTNLSQRVFPFEKISLPKSDTLQKLDENDRVSFNEVKAIFEKELASKRIYDWSVDSSENMASRLLISRKNQCITIRNDISIPKSELMKLVKHEIDVHIKRYRSSKIEDYPILEIGTKEGRQLEEGIACYYEADGKPTARIVLRHQLVKMALERSFAEVFSYLVDQGYSPQESWMNVMRVKRGMKDTSLPGAFTKDAQYLQGFMKIKNAIDNKIISIDKLLLASTGVEDHDNFEL